MQQSLLTRLIIFKIVKKLRFSSNNFNEVFYKETHNHNLKDVDKKLIHNVVLNSMRWSFWVEKIIQKYSDKYKKDNDTYFLLLTGITQLLILKFKDYAVINDTVQLAKLNQINSNYKFINAILRNINRNKNNDRNAEYAFNCLPEWFVKKVKKWNDKCKRKFIESIRKEPSLHIIFKNKNLINDNLGSHIKTTDSSLILMHNEKIQNIADYKKGYWWIQDLSSMLPLNNLKKLDNKEVVDLCSAPGGKTIQLLNQNAKLVAYEKSPDRAKILEDNIQRLNFKCDVKIQNILKIDEKKKFDYVILDCPCSAVGTIRRHPEIFYRKSEPNFNKLIDDQTELLLKASRLVKKNGILFYMVCSFLNEEGENQITSFLTKNKNFILDKFKSKEINNFNQFITKDGYYTTLPSSIKKSITIDGFFAAKIKRVV